MKPGDFVAALFLARDVTHRVHLSTRSYAKHMALAGFYEAVVGLADSFAETYQGRHGVISNIPLASTKQSGNVLDFLEGQLKEIEEERYKVCDRDETAIQNIIDEIVALYLTTIYKLKFLA